MISALLYLRLTSFKNWLRTRALRLRQPKYLLGALVGGAYFYFVLFRPLFARSRGVREVVDLALIEPSFPAELQPALLALAAIIVVAVALLFGWVLPSDRPGLTFSEAEVSFLFPAPVTRRTLIHYKLLSAQFGILFTSLFFTLISNRWSFLGGSVLTHALGWWLILSTLNLHFMGAGFVITRLVDRGVGHRRRRWWLLALVIAIVGGAALLVWPELSTPTGFDLVNLRTLAAYLDPLLNTGVLPWLLLPAKWTVAPFIAESVPTFLLALPGAALILGAHYFWVLRAETAFEEASVELAQKRGARLAAIREGRLSLGRSDAKARSAPFRLRSHGRPEIAFLWKNLLSTRPYFNLRVAAVIALVLIAACSWIARHPVLHEMSLALGAAAMIFGGYTLLIGPQLARQDLRSDLAHADILKTYPLRGWQVALGQLLAPIAILTVILWLALLAWALSFHSPQVDWATPKLRAILALCLAIMAPLLCALQLIVPNGATLIFPAWAHVGRARGGGIEVMGQRMIFVFGQLLTMIVALLPAVLGGVLLGFAAHWFFPVSLSLVFGTAGTIVVLGLEVWLGLLWLGRRFEKFDLSAEAPHES